MSTQGDINSSSDGVVRLGLDVDDDVHDVNMTSSPNNNHYGSSSSEAKRRKGNDGGVIGVVRGGFFLSTWLSSFFNWLRWPYTKMRQDNEMLVGRLDSMEKLMNKMAEKLELLDYPNAVDSDNDSGEEGSDSSDEEDEGNSDDEESGENLSPEQLEGKGRALVAYQEMISNNRDEWKYSAEDLCLADIEHYDDDEIMMLSRSIKACTIKMRRGEYHYRLNEELSENNDIDELAVYGVLLEPHENVHNHEDRIHFDGALKPHWEEFADALNTFDLTLGILDDDVESTFQISRIQLSITPWTMITKALKGKSFKHYKFRNNDLSRYAIRSLIDIIDSNSELRSLTLHDNPIDLEDQVDFVRSIAKHPNLSAISLDGCCEIGYYLFAAFIHLQLVEISMKNGDWGRVSDTDKPSLIETLAAPDSWLEKLDLSANNLTDNDAAIIADALQTNNTLIELVLEHNRFTESCGQLFGNALRVNQTLETLLLDEDIAGSAGISNALFDRSSLNSASDSNHTCYVPQSSYDLNERLNERANATENRHRKIYNVLSRRNKEMSNTQHFGDIDVNLLPEVLLAVQHYSSAPKPSSIHFTYDINEEVNALSIVHEIILKWDKALTLYETLGGSCDGAQK